MKSRFPVFQNVAELNLNGPREILPHKITQIALSSHKAHQGDGAIRIGGFHELDKLRAFATDEINVCRMARQPQHQLIKK